MAKRLGRTAILGIKPRTLDIENIPGWEGFITVKELSAKDVEDITKLRGKRDSAAVDLSVQYMISTIVDEDGKRIFQKGDAAKLLDLGYEAITYITEEILKFSGLLDEDDKDGEETEDVGEA